MRFQTDAMCNHCQKTILAEMNRRFPNMEWSLDLDSANKVLECHGIPDDAEMAQRVVSAIEETGFKGSWLPAGE